MDRGTTKKYICIAQANVGMHKVTLHEGLQLLVCLWAEVNCMWHCRSTGRRYSANKTYDF